VPGPQHRQIGDRIVVAYRNILYVDYIDMPGTMTAALTARIDATEYKARILALSAVYWILGIRPGPGKTVNDLLRQKSVWAVLSFRHVAPEDAALQAAAAAGKPGGSAPLLPWTSIIEAHRLRTQMTSRSFSWTCSRKHVRLPTAGASS
jgi:hypothetical protein